MERDSSSDEEDDRHNLIPQNDDVKHHLPSPHRSAFHIDDLHSTVRRRFAPLHFNKRYLLAVLLPLLILVLYFSIDVHSLFPTHLRFDRMRESELRALYLLRQQQLGLFTLWNTSQLGTDNNSFVPSAALLDDVKSAVLKQISFNKQIQQVLLSSHRTGNGSVSESEANFQDPSFGAGYGFDRCRRADQKLSERRTIEWKPKSNKYLFAICVSGQMSNHLICLEKHMFFAALLNRVLVIPSSKVDFQYNRVLDIDRVNQCLGRKVVVSFEEFSVARKNHMHIDRFICYFSLPQPCFADEEHIKKLKSLGISMGKPEPAWVEDIKKPNKRTVQDVQSKFASDDDVIAIGDVFYADVEQDWVMQPGGPIAHKCKTLIEPSRLIMLTAQRFIQTFLGKNFIALHFRRHGFLKFCNVKTPSCFFPIPQAADCIIRIVEKGNTPVIYLSTDAAESETSLLQSLVVLNGKAVPLVKRPPRNSAEKWDALLYRHGLGDDSQVEAMLDKTICALSSVFIGAPGSTFTEDILRLRKDWGSASMCDEYLCQGEEPNFIADNE
ncbi:O-fucosyltransferase 36-like [Alnus glutinosa]|uniref:O-fucosyltransferase 36-like n=1 Tax=Alnus glutinosa TaxID=3517 RepID=UPI002D789E63|nr:O-fucosyltransferase 36-like [Alnus glutinosa]